MLNLAKCLPLAGVFGFLVSIIIPGMLSLRDGSFLYQSYGSKMVFRRRPTLRASQAILGFLMSVGGLISFWYNFAGASDASSNRVVFVALWAVFAVPSFVTGILMVRLSGLEDLYLDLNQRTYRLVSGWPLFPATKSGDWNDMAGIYVRDFSSSTSVGVSWRYNNKHKTPLGRFERNSSASQFAQEMSSKLELPRIAVQK